MNQIKNPEKHYQQTQTRRNNVRDKGLSKLNTTCKLKKERKE